MRFRRPRENVTVVIEERWPLCLVAIGALALAMGVATLDPYPIGAAVDDAMYVMLAKALATGQGFRSLNLPGAPFNTHFPPGYPAALSVLWRLWPAFPENVVLFRAFNIICFAAIAVGTAQFAQEYAGRTVALLLGVVTAISVPVLVLVAMLLSEPFFLALLVFLLPALERFARIGGANIRTGILLGVATGACTLVRSHGIVLLPAVAIVLGVRSRWRDAGVFVLASLLVIGPWQLWCRQYANTLSAPLLGGYDSYTAWWVRGLGAAGWQMIPRTLARTTTEAVEMFGALFSPFRGRLAHAVTSGALAIVALTGTVAARKTLTVSLLFLLGYLGIVAIWPFQPGRFIWGIWPVLLMIFVVGAREAFMRTGLSSLRVVSAVACLWCTWGYSAYEIRAIRGRWWASIPRSASQHIALAVDWTAGNTPRDAVIATEDQGSVYLYTGRKTVPVLSFTALQYLQDSPAAQNAAEGLIPIMKTYPVQVAIVYTRAAIDVAQFVAGQPDPHLLLIGQYAGGAIYAVPGQ